jgi:hypothetical protein
MRFTLVIGLLKFDLSIFLIQQRKIFAPPEAFKGVDEAMNK